MLLDKLFKDRSSQDYRECRDSRARRKRRLRLRQSIGMALLVCLLLAVSLGTVSAQVRAQPEQPLEMAPMKPAPMGLQGAEDPVAMGDLGRLKSQANAPGRGAARAAWLLGLVYLHGSGVARDPAQAALWFERARDLGEPLSSAGLAWCEIEGCKGTPDPAGARRWIAQLRNLNPARADYLEWVVASRLLPVQLANPRADPAIGRAAAPAQELLRRSAQQGDVNALIELGLQSMTAGNLAEAQDYFKAAAPKSQAAASNLVIVSERIKKAAPATPAFMSAHELLASAQRHHRGEGQTANYTEAIRMYQLAAGKGSVEARQMLALIFSRITPSGDIDVPWMQHLSQLDLSKDAPALNTVTGGQMFKREPSALFELLPEVWRNRTQAVAR